MSCVLIDIQSWPGKLFENESFAAGFVEERQELRFESFLI